MHDRYQWAHHPAPKTGRQPDDPAYRCSVRWINEEPDPKRSEIDLGGDCLQRITLSRLATASLPINIIDSGTVRRKISGSHNLQKHRQGRRARSTNVAVRLVRSLPDLVAGDDKVDQEAFSPIA
jgi:hypothetical protein